MHAALSCFFVVKDAVTLLVGSWMGIFFSDENVFYGKIPLLQVVGYDSHAFLCKRWVRVSAADCLALGADVEVVGFSFVVLRHCRLPLELRVGFVSVKALNKF